MGGMHSPQAARERSGNNDRVGTQSPLTGPVRVRIKRVMQRQRGRRQAARGIIAGREGRQSKPASGSTTVPRPVQPTFEHDGQARPQSFGRLARTGTRTIG